MNASSACLIVCPFCCSVRQSVPRTEEGRCGRWPVVRHESAEEGYHRTEEEDHGAHQDRAAGVGGCAAVTLPGHPPLRIPDGRQAPPHLR